MTRQHRRDAGVSTLEYIGLAIVAAIVLVVVAATVPNPLNQALSRAICQLTQQQVCPGASQDPSKGGRTPLERATWGVPWWGGDSFSAGEGVGDYDPATNVTGFNWRNPKTWDPRNLGKDRNMCHRSTYSYQAQTHRALQNQGYFAGQEYSSEACSGAKVQDLHDNNHEGNASEGPQAQSSAQPDPNIPHLYDTIPPNASLISMSMGGNDIGFGQVLTNCVTRGRAGSGCMDTATIEGAMQRMYGTQGQLGVLEKELAQIKQMHPDARIIIMGYPPLFSEKPPYREVTAINPLTGKPYTVRLPQWNGSGMSVEQQRWANEMAGKINTYLSDMCGRLGIEFVDPTPAFVGDGYDHRIGSADPRINGLSAWDDSGDWTVNKESFHPNRAGHDAETELLMKKIREG